MFVHQPILGTDPKEKSKILDRTYKDVHQYVRVPRYGNNVVMSYGTATTGCKVEPKCEHT